MMENIPSFAALLEEDREKVRSGLAASETALAAQTVLSKELDALLYRYVEENESDVRKSAASKLIAVAKVSLGLADTNGEAKVWERTIGEAEEEKGKYGAALVFLLIGAAMVIGAIVAFAVTMPEAARGGFSLALLAFLFAGIAFLFFAGSLFQKAKDRKKYGIGRKKKSRKDPVKEQRIEIKPDAGKLYQVFQAMLLMIDESIEEAEREEKSRAMQKEAESGGPFSGEELELFAGLLEASESGDPDYAADKLADVGYFLHKAGVETVSYSAEHENWFELMPGKKSGTLRPALVKGGRLLKKGLASTEV